jgi:hypothetical protein
MEKEIAVRHLIVTAMAASALCGCSDQATPTSTGSYSAKQAAVPGEKGGHELSSTEAKALIPKATSITNADWERLAKSQQPSPSLIKSESLSLILVGSLNPIEAGKKNPAVLNDFKYVGKNIPEPSVISDHMWQSKSKGYATMLQPESLTGCQVKTENGTATGTVAFEVKGLFSGNVEFTAHHKDGSWRIQEFRLPNYDIKTVLADDGVWKKSVIGPEK